MFWKLGNSLPAATPSPQAGTFAVPELDVDKEGGDLHNVLNNNYRLQFTQYASCS